MANKIVEALKALVDSAAENKNGLLVWEEVQRIIDEYEEYASLSPEGREALNIMCSEAAHAYRRDEHYFVKGAPIDSSDACRVLAEVAASCGISTPYEHIDNDFKGQF